MLSLAPLWAYIAARWRPVTRGSAKPGWTMPAFTAIDLAETVGVSVRCVHRWRAEGLSWVVADRVAVAIGTHPANVWGDEWWERIPALFEEMESCGTGAFPVECGHTHGDAPACVNTRGVASLNRANGRTDVA